MPSATYSTEAIVLRTRLIGEKDRVMTLFSPEEGKFDATARGARNPKSKLAATSQPFVHARFLIARGRSLDIASQAEVETAHPHISADLWRTAWATLVCETCSIVPERQNDPLMFEILKLSLGAFNDETRNADDIELAGLWFQAQFLSHAGYAPTIGRCVVSGEKIVVPPDDLTARVAFSPTLGGTLCTAQVANDVYRMNVLAQSLRALRVLERAAQPPFESDLQRSTGELFSNSRRDLRDVLKLTLAYHLDARPKSQKFLDEVRDSFDNKSYSA